MSDKNTKKAPKSKNKKTTKKEASIQKLSDEIRNKSDLKNFLLSIRDKMAEDTAAPVYALTALNHIMGLPAIYSYLDDDNKELARDIWLRIKQAGFQVKNPPLLFSEEEAVASD